MAELITVELKFVKDAPTYVEGTDKKGFSRAFEKSNHSYRIEGKKLFVEVDKMAWERRMKRTPVVKPMRQAAKKKQTRKCLICHHDFQSEGAGNRICPPCKKTANWQSGSDCITHI